MMRSLYTGASGVKIHQTKMDVIGNNISNVNTVGFKAGRTTFADMLSQNITAAAPASNNVGATNAKQIGLGGNVSAIDTIFKDGSIVETGKNTDLALSGDGLFVVRNGNQVYYTRDGAFEFDANGDYVLPGSGNYVQGWMASEDGVINPAGAVSDINVALGQTMAPMATNLINYYDNLDADVPIVTGIKGGNLSTKVVYTDDVSAADPLPVTIGGKRFTVIGLSDNWDTTDTWTAKDDIPLGATTAEYINENGDVVTATLSPAATFEVPKGSPVVFSTNILTKGSVSETYPAIAYIGDKQYTIIGMDKNYDVSKTWTLKNVASTGSNTITITSDDGDLTLTLASPLEEDIGQGSRIAVEKTSTIASATNPATLTLSDGSTVVVTDGAYQIGNGMPISNTVTVYDSLGATHELPVYFIREGNIDSGGVISSTDKWLVSLTPNASVVKGEETTTEFVDAAGNVTTVKLNANEIQFDNTGKLISESKAEETDLIGTLTMTTTPVAVDTDETAPVAPVVPTEQIVTLNFSKLTQYAGNTTLTSNANGNVEGVLTKIEIDSSGVINGIYTNGKTRPEAQVAVAHFTNFPGLLKNGTSLYQQSDNSGLPVINAAGNLGVTITPRYLEMSNVDVANEFAEMIITQRGFQSNTKVVTVTDQMIETAINMKQR